MRRPDIGLESYSAEELEAALTFQKTHEGAAVTQSNIAFSRALGVLVAKRMQQSALKQAPLSKDSTSTESPLNDQNLKGVDIVEHVLNGATYFTGRVENHGTQTSHGIEVEVDLFAAGKFVDQYTSYITGSLPAGASRYFKAACGCKDSPPAVHDSFKVEIHESY